MIYVRASHHEGNTELEERQARWKVFQQTQVIRYAEKVVLDFRTKEDVERGLVKLQQIRSMR